MSGRGDASRRVSRSARLRRWVVSGSIAAVDALTLGYSTGQSKPLPAPVAVDAFTTDSIGYKAQPVERMWDTQRYAFTVIARFENRGPAAVYLSRCFTNSPGPTYGIQRVGAPDSLPHGRRDGAAYDKMWACVGHDRQWYSNEFTVRLAR
jgi:hypothetical protein